MVDRCYVIVSLAGGFGLSPLRRVRAWWNDDPSFGAVTHNGVICWTTIIGAIGSDLTDLVVDLVEQGFHLRDIASFLIRQGMAIISPLSASRARSGALSISNGDFRILSKTPSPR